MSKMEQILISVVSILALLVSTVSGAVFTIDFGSESIKIAVVNPQPGQSPISIAINEMSKRKSPALVAISNGERLLAEEASGIIARYPDRVYSLTREMLGKPILSVESLIKSKHLPYDLVADSQRGTVKIRAHDKKAEYSVEEIVAMILSYAQDLANTHAKAVIKDAVISIPPYFGQSQRQAIMDAGRIAGINIMSLIHEHSGAALQYGFDKDFSNESRHVVFYDMGASSTYAAVVHFSSYLTKDRGRNVSANQFQVKGVRWDAELGGQSMENRLVEYFASEFNQNNGGSIDVRSSPKSMAKLKKEVKRTKEILSANSEAPINVESLYEELDFKSSITREKFEHLCSDLWERALTPLKTVLEDCNLKSSDLFAIELLGGATRVPKLKSTLSDFIGEKGLDRHLDADEAIALGSSLFAANLSDGFKLNRKIGMIDGIMYGVLFKAESLNGGSSLHTSAGEGEGEGEGEEGGSDGLVLFPRLKKLPTKVMRSLKNQTEDLRLTLTYDPSGNLPDGVPSHVLAVYEVSGISNASAKYETYNLTQPLRTSLHFSLSRSGLVSLDRAETVVDFYEWVEITVPVQTENTTVNSVNASDTSPSSSASSSDEKGSPSGDEKSTKQSNKDGDELNDEVKSKVNVTDSIVEDSSPKFIVQKKLRRRTIRVPLKVRDISEGYSKPMNEDDFHIAIEKINELKKKEMEKKATAEAKNGLESFIYSMKDKFEYSEDIAKVSTQKQRNVVNSELVQAEEWLYMDGEDANATEFKNKLNEIRVNADSILFRANELNERPKAVTEAKSFISKTKNILNSWETSRPWINKTDIDQVLNDIKDFETWISQKESSQLKIPLHEIPAFTSAEVAEKVDIIQKKVGRLLKIQKPRPKPTPKPEKNETSSSKQETSSSDASDESPPKKQQEKEEKIEIPSEEKENEYEHDDL